MSNITDLTTKGLKLLNLRFRPASVVLLFLSCSTLTQAAFPQECIGCLPGISHASPPQNQLERGIFVDPSSWIIHTRVDEVMAFFTVTKGRKYIDDLALDDVHITDNRKSPKRISAFGRQSDLPLRLGLLLDASDSVQPRFRFEQDSSSRFLQDILRPNKDLTFVLAFTDRPILMQDFTDDTALLSESISFLRPGGETALYDAIGAACQRFNGLNDNETAARVLILLSDGDDNASKLTLTQAIHAAQLAQVTIYAISTNNSHVLDLGDHILERLAIETGGIAFFPDNSKDTAKAFRSIALEMRSRYLISYEPEDFVLDGKFRAIHITARKDGKKLEVHARRGYYASSDRHSSSQQLGLTAVDSGLN